MTDKDVSEYRTRLKEHDETIMEADVQLKRAVGEWPEISTAIERLGLQDYITAADVSVALARAHSAEGDAEFASAEKAAKTLLRLADPYDGTVARAKAQDGAAVFLDLVLPILRGVSAERPGPSAKRRSSPAPGISTAEATDMLQAWQRFQATAAPTQADISSLRQAASACGLYPPTDMQSGDAVRQWALGTESTEGAVNVAQRLHAAHCGVFTPGGWLGSDLSALQPERSVMLTSVEHFSVFQGKDGAGAIDVLMLRDPATGEMLPETEHAELAAHVRAQMQEWTCDKAYGSRTFALTQNAAEVMYDCWFDRRGNRRARVKSSDALADTMVTVTGRLRRFAAECEQPTGSLQELLAAAEACGIRPTDEELAGLKYRDLQWQHKRIAEGYIVRTSPATARAARCAMVVAVAEAEVASLQTTNSTASVPILTDCGVRLLEPQHDRMQSADTVSLRSDTALCNPFSPWCQKHGGTLIPRCQQCEQAVGTAREAFKALLVDSDGADVHTTATILGVARQKGTKNGLPSEASAVQMDAQRREALHELYTLCRSLPDVALECPAPAEESHGGIVAYWLQREWPTVSLRGLRVQASARTAAAQPPDTTDVWVYGQQVEVLQNFDKTPVWLTARYIRGSGSTNTVELLSQTNDGVTVVKDAALRRMPPWPLADWATRMLAGGAIDAPFHGGFASARLMKVDQKAGGVISWKARLQVTKTDITVNPADARPACGR